MIRKLVISCVVIMLIAVVAAYLQKPKLDEKQWCIADEIGFEYAIYYLPSPQQDALEAARKLLKARFPMLSEGDTQESVQFRLEQAVAERYRPPDLGSLKYCGRGLSSTQSDALQGSRTALVMRFRHDKEQVLSALRSADAFVGELAKKTGGLVWDEQTRLVFTPEQWDKSCVASWEEPVPAAADQIAIHAYKNGEYVRAITLGMEKFGRPDLVINELAWSNSRLAGHTINLVAQALVEGQEVGPRGALDLDIRSIKCASVRGEQVRAFKEHANGKAPLRLAVSKLEKGDRDNRLLEIQFDRADGNDIHAKQERALADCFGWTDKVSYVKHSDALLKASANARAKLPAVHEAFSKGLQPGERLMVKAPFETSNGGNEWMWVEVTKWANGEINGLLTNEPANCPQLHSGQVVNVHEKDLFDYILYRADGSMEGNETSKVIEQMDANQ